MVLQAILRFSYYNATFLLITEEKIMKMADLKPCMVFSTGGLFISSISTLAILHNLMIFWNMHTKADDQVYKNIFFNFF